MACTRGGSTSSVGDSGDTAQAEPGSDETPYKSSNLTLPTLSLLTPAVSSWIFCQRAASLLKWSPEPRVARYQISLPWHVYALNALLISSFILLEALYSGTNIINCVGIISRALNYDFLLINYVKMYNAFFFYKYL